MRESSDAEPHGENRNQPGAQKEGSNIFSGARASMATPEGTAYCIVLRQGAQGGRGPATRHTRRGAERGDREALRDLGDKGLSASRASRRS